MKVVHQQLQSVDIILFLSHSGTARQLLTDNCGRGLDFRKHQTRRYFLCSLLFREYDLSDPLQPGFHLKIDRFQLADLCTLLCFRFNNFDKLSQNWRESVRDSDILIIYIIHCPKNTIYYYVMCLAHLKMLFKYKILSMMILTLYWNIFITQISHWPV